MNRNVDGRAAAAAAGVVVDDDDVGDDVAAWTRPADGIRAAGTWPIWRRRRAWRCCCRRTC